MSALLNTGRSDHQIINETTDSFRPQAAVRASYSAGQLSGVARNDRG
jgi:hypothetical protein